MTALTIEARAPSLSITKAKTNILAVAVHEKAPSETDPLRDDTEFALEQDAEKVSLQLKKSFTRVLTKPLMIPHIFRDHFNGRMSAVLFHLEQIGVLATCLGQETGAERVA